MKSDLIYILDTSAIISRKINLLSENVVIPRSVFEEIRKGKLRFYLETDVELLRILSPKSDSLEKVIKESSLTGDLASLSSTDIDVLALAYELNAVILTDDYSIQNVASSLGIEFAGTDLKPIKKRIMWKYRCTGCGQEYTEYVDACGVCGHKVKRYPAKKHKDFPKKE